MKLLEFSFRHAEKDNGRNLVNALLHHAYPKRHSLLFAYDYKYNNGIACFLFTIHHGILGSHITIRTFLKKHDSLGKEMIGKGNWKERSAKIGEYH